MPYVVMAACIDVLDRTCVDNCPVDSIYQGERASYIQPDECIECGACVDVCPVDAIAHDSEVPADQRAHVADNAAFFAEVLTGRDGPIGSPQGAAALGPVGVDTPLVSQHPR